MKRIALLLAAAVAVAIVLTPGIAFANFAIHGGYTKDTASCAGCHRAHTSFSSVTWTDNSDGVSQRSALLVSNATKMYEFCFACHGNDAQGAETNVEGGQYKGTLYGTPNGQLNGGFAGDFSIISGMAKTSDHIIDGSWGAYGGGNFGDPNPANATGDIPGHRKGTGNEIIMTCASCHDPHGSSNYRLLADTVNGIARGGYSGGTVEDPNPVPYVVSVEPGYPNGYNGTKGVGWRKHEFGAAQITAAPPYVPNYTQAMYAMGPETAGQPDRTKGMSGWCVGCHTVYMEMGSTSAVFPTAQSPSPYDSGDDWGRQNRHRHPINISLAQGYDNKGGYGAGRALTVELPPAENIPLPLANNPATESVGATNTAGDWMECLTCHVAHGTSAIMRGFANVNSVVTDPSNPAYAGGIVADSGTLKNGSGGVPPTGDSALLRRDNRGVCEVCHDK